VSQLIIQDDTPVDNLLHEKQMRLLTEPLYTSWKTEKPFLALANVGLFHEPRQTPVVPDVMLSTEVAALPEDWREHKEHLSYFVWERGKVPDVVIEIVSNTKGQELGAKMERYARLHVPFYVVYDPEHHIQEQTLTCHVLLGTEYDRFPEPLLFKKLGIGLKLWQGIFENQEGEWLRWTDPAGEVIPTGAELAAREARRAEAAERRAAEEAERAEAAERRLAELEARLKAMEK
jgi:Uma2 family endonuclease